MIIERETTGQAFQSYKLSLIVTTEQDEDALRQLSVYRSQVIDAVIEKWLDDEQYKYGSMSADELRMKLGVTLHSIYELIDG